jgi:hypothetical protein
MPVLAVFNEAGQLISNAGPFILATMLVPAGPDDAVWRLHVDALTADTALDLGADVIALDRAVFNRLYDAGRPFVESDQSRRERHGEQVGDILLVVRTLSREQPAKASLGKAIRLHAESMRQSDDVRLLRAERKLREAWVEFESVAHLWGAYRTLRRNYGEGAGVDWLLLLALAEHYRRWGEGHHSPAGRTGTGRLSRPLLHPGTGWRAPTHATLPPLEEASNLDRLQLGDRADEMIRDTPVPVR